MHTTASIEQRRASVVFAPLAFALLVPLAASFATAPALPPSAGQVFESFASSATEDSDAFRRDERAIWGPNSAVTAWSHFPGSGGPGGNFSWVVETGSTFVLDTSFSILADPSHGTTTAVIQGRVDVHDVWIQNGAVLRIVGPNPCRIAATGTIRIDGLVDARGTNARGVVAFNYGGPDGGATGGPGGGRGGTGSILSTQSTPKGENGYGAFNALNGGGGGGESAFSGAMGGVDFRRPPGGGGGRFAADVILNALGCADQSRIGLDAERGGPAHPTASGALGGPGVAPQPGLPGAGPFVNAAKVDDFWGRMRLPGGAVITGELSRPWAGAGGGAGGDACWTALFPTTPYDPTTDEIGAGGGGGGGSLVIDALGDIVIGAHGRIDVSGGTGGGGENTSGLDRVGGGSGGGSGGHLVLQAGRTIDLRECAGGTSAAYLRALGGQGGEGRNGVGGAGPIGVPTSPGLDSINLTPPFDPSCLPPSNPHDVMGSGGDGGPGVIQLHVNELSDILTPVTAGITLASVVSPPPVGAMDVNAPATWNRLIPMFGPRSMSRSIWYPLPTSGPIDLRFEGTAADGSVLTNGSGPNARVARLAPIASGTLSTGPFVLPYVDVDFQTLVIAASSISDDVWRLDPTLLVGAELDFAHNGEHRRFAIAAASSAGATLRLTVEGVGALVTGVGAGDTFELRPRYFRVATDGVRDSLPGSARIRITFQGAPALPGGGPDVAQAGAFTADENALESIAGLAFVRFQVDFDLTADGSELTASARRPSLEFLRIPFRN